MAGFSLVELLLALGLGLLLSTLMLQALLAHGTTSERLQRLLRERTLQRRTLELIRGELQLAKRVELGATGTILPSCALAGRQPLLRLLTAQGTITYSLGAPPSSIWRGSVLMRCGPAFGLDGQLSTGAPQNRVVIDGLTSGGLVTTMTGAGRLHLRLTQQFKPLSGSPQTIVTEAHMAAELGMTEG
ncbi:MAG: prepilin-type cleavage/methylation domain-containing protein [Cyanobium sp.]